MAVVVIMSYGGKTMVWPPCVVVRPGEEVVFKCLNTPAAVFLPKPEIFTVGAALASTSTAAGVTMSLSSNQAVGKLKVKGETISVGGKTTYAPGSAAPGVYPYSAYCKSPNDFAEGNSSPVIIIEPPDPGVWPDVCLSMVPPSEEPKESGGVGLTP